MRLAGAGPAEWVHLLRAQRALIAAEWARRRRKTGDLLALSGAAWNSDAPALDMGPVPPGRGASGRADDPRGAATSTGVSAQAGREGNPVAMQSGPDAESLRDARAVTIAARYGVFRPLCLTRSIALQSMLRRRGIQATVRVGARRKGGRLEAHAWVELEGAVLGDSPEHVAGFAPLGGFQGL